MTSQNLEKAACTHQLTLAEFLHTEKEKHNLCPTLCLIIQDIAQRCQQISQRVRTGQLGGVLGSLDQENIQGEVQQKLDIIANDMLLDNHHWHSGLAAIASEEMDDIYVLNGQANAPYLLLFDPLDGSSNINVNVSIGTIFSILKNPKSKLTEKSFLQPGHQQVAAGYAIYGPQTMLVFTVGHGVYGFTLEPNLGIWVLTHKQIKIPKQTKEFAINMSNMRHWWPAVRHYIDDCLAGKLGQLKKDYNMRWVASMVADVHRILMRGGVFMYPRDQRPDVLSGKLRLLYEANPMSLIITQAGGLAIDNPEPLLEIAPKELHQRVGVILGSKDEVTTIINYFKEHK